MKLDRKKIEIARARKQMSVMDLAKAYGVSRARMNIILNQCNITINCAGRLAAVLDCDVTEIIED